MFLKEKYEQLEREFLDLVNLQEHYAALLNSYDGGARTRWRSDTAWIRALIERELGTQQGPARPGS